MNSNLAAPQINSILTFWFGDPQFEDTGYAQRRKLWFAKSLEVDQQISTRFQLLYEQAVAGGFPKWQQSPQGCLALLLLFDQFPRNMFRGTPQAFATDTQALQVAKTAIDRGFDQACPSIQRIFFYLPFEHSENLADQRRSIELSGRLVAEATELTDVFDYAIRHQQVIERFGRFPHRNMILDRLTTPEEAEFLQQPGSSF